MFTVKLCSDLSGWFASLSDDLADYPGVTVHSEQVFETHDHALRALDLTQVLAQRLADSPVAPPRFGVSPFAAAGNRARTPAFVGRRSAVHTF
jgi:hypothetical protein